MSTGSSHYERRAARQRQLEMMEASASGVLPTMELDVSSTDSGGVFNSIRQRNQETARRFLHDEDEDSNRRTSVNTAHAELFGRRDGNVSSMHAVNLMDHETGVYGEPEARDYGSNFVDALFGVKDDAPAEHDAVPSETDVYLGDGSKPPRGRASRIGSVCSHLRRKTATGRKLRYLVLGIILFVLILSFMMVSRQQEAHREKVIYEENSQRYYDILETISLQGISHKSALEADESAQRDALRWVAYSDPARLEPTDPMMMQRYILAVFYYGSFRDFVTDHGEQKPIEQGDRQFEGIPVPGWHRRDHWLSEKGVCAWYGVKCEERELPDGSTSETYDDDAKIVAMEMGYNHLYGKLPREFKGLESLTRINFAGNDLKGSLPPEIARMFTLKKLDLRNNDLTGQLPQEIRLLGGMEELYLSKNGFTGPVPQGIAELYNLRALDLDDNAFSGEFPSIKDLTLLESLILSNNGFSKRIPESFTHLENLRELHLEYNDFSGPIPAGLDQLSQLTSLWLQQNSLTGELPGGLFASNSNLETIYLEFNSFSGGFPGSMGQLENLVSLKLHDNGFTGSIPDTWTNLKSLRELHMQNNEIKGPFPNSIGAMHRLRELFLDHNKLDGKLPASLGGATNLETVHLDHNQLTGEVPVEVSQIGTLSTLRLEENSFTGSVPEEVCDMTEQGNLGYISIDCPDEVNCDCCKCS